MDLQKELNEWADWFIPHDSEDLRDALELNSFNQLNVEKLLAINGLSESYVFRAKDSWKAWQAAKAQAVPEGFEIGRLQDRITELLDERQELYAQLDRTEEDSKRINFLADKNQWIANVQLPREIVERNLSSLRNAIDRAMDLAAQEPTK
jgi:hypothetical protein